VNFRYALLTGISRKNLLKYMLSAPSNVYRSGSSMNLPPALQIMPYPTGIEKIPINLTVKLRTHLLMVKQIRNQKNKSEIQCYVRRLK
jgi:hypothetical protein